MPLRGVKILAVFLNSLEGDHNMDGANGPEINIRHQTQALQGRHKNNLFSSVQHPISKQINRKIKAYTRFSKNLRKTGNNRKNYFAPSGLWLEGRDRRTMGRCPILIYHATSWRKNSCSIFKFPGGESYHGRGQRPRNKHPPPNPSPAGAE
jgi:hypothetical protein